jgi:phage shock protein PspC (stress-responsive transcriptional regulator)
MFSLITFMAAIGTVGGLAQRYGVDTRRDDGRKF